MKYLIALLLITNLSFAQEWTKTELNDYSSIEFPIAPEKTVQNGDVYYSTSDDYGVYLVMIRNMGNQKISESELPQFYEGFMDGALKSVNGELLKQNEFNTNGIIGNEMVYLANSNPQLPNLRYKRVILKNNNLISYEFWTFEESEQIASKNKEKFFNSISVSDAKVAEPENSEKEKENSAYESGFLIGKVVFYLFVIGLIIGGILLIRKLTKKKNKNVG
ncbi:hypothetical protein BFP78_15520 [Gaetbulibacter sp. 5U11]|jgi:hypothetical protein|nr:hypothetical protein BFP78_15520 [Gaetbulibacter sp. 5U11]